MISFLYSFYFEINQRKPIGKMKQHEWRTNSSTLVRKWRKKGRMYVVNAIKILQIFILWKIFQQNNQFHYGFFSFLWNFSYQLPIIDWKWSINHSVMNRLCTVLFYYKAMFYCCNIKQQTKQQICQIKKCSN